MLELIDLTKLIKLRAKNWLAHLNIAGHHQVDGGDDFDTVSSIISLIGGYFRPGYHIGVFEANYNSCVLVTTSPFDADLFQLHHDGIMASIRQLNLTCTFLESDGFKQSYYDYSMVIHFLAAGLVNGFISLEELPSHEIIDRAFPRIHEKFVEDFQEQVALLADVHKIDMGNPVWKFPDRRFAKSQTMQAVE